MNKIKIFIIICALILSKNSSFAGDFKLLINYIEGENSKDSWSKVTLITIDQQEYSYSLSTSGHTKVNNENKNGDFTDTQLVNLKDYVRNNNLLVRDTLYYDTTNYDSYERYAKADIKIFVDTNVYYIGFKGNLINFNDEPLYKKTIGLINLIEDYIKKD